MAEKLNDLEKLLRDLSLKVGDVDRERIQQALAQVCRGSKCQLFSDGLSLDSL